jgi:sodium/hydrogen antiporter
MHPATQFIERLISDLTGVQVQNPASVRRRQSMEVFNAHAFALTLALVGMVIVVAALLSGFIERSNVPQVAVFLGLGAMLGPYGLGMLHVTLDSPLLRVVATLSLALVLFTDALELNIPEARKHSGLALLVLGPGTILSALLIALAGWGLLGLPPAGAAVLGAALASTDPVLLRGFLSRKDVPATARQALRLESGLNDVVLLPVVLVAMEFMGQAASHAPSHWARLGMELFLLGPGAGVLVGLVAVATLDLVRRRIGVRRDYESIYSLGVAFTAFAAAESVHGSGFLAVFAAGLTISALDVELCDCFLDYGSSTAELALLFTFVLFGSSLIWSGLGVLTGATLLFALLTLLIRPVAFLLSLVRARIPKRDKLLIAWFGPRGLSSLLLVLLAVFERRPDSERLFALCSLVVLVSVALHGGSLMLMGRGSESKNRGDAEETPPQNEPEPEVETVETARPTARLEALTLPALDSVDRGDGTEKSLIPESAEYITIEELRRMWDSGVAVTVLDVRSERTFEESDMLAADAIRLMPDRAVTLARRMGLPRDAWIALFCT